MARTSNAQGQIPTGKQDTPYVDTTKLVQAVFARGAEMQAGTVTGTGASLDVTLTFDPAVVWLCKSAGAGAPTQSLKHPGLADDDCIHTVAAGTVTVDAAGQITLGTQGQKKFNIGTDAAINEAGQPIRWIAFGFSSTDGQ